MSAQQRRPAQPLSFQNTVFIGLSQRFCAHTDQRLFPRTLGFDGKFYTERELGAPSLTWEVGSRQTKAQPIKCSLQSG